MAEIGIVNGKVASADTPEDVAISKGIYSFAFNAEGADIRMMVGATVDNGSNPPVGVLVPAGTGVVFRGYPQSGTISIESAGTPYYSIVETPIA